MNVAPATRRANLWLFIGLVAFAIGLCVLVLLWMRTRTRAQGGQVYPPVGTLLLVPFRVTSRHPGRGSRPSAEGKILGDRVVNGCRPAGGWESLLAGQSAFAAAAAIFRTLSDSDRSVGSVSARAGRSPVTAARRRLATKFAG